MKRLFVAAGLALVLSTPFAASAHSSVAVVRHAPAYNYHHWKPQFWNHSYSRNRWDRHDRHDFDKRRFYDDKHRHRDHGDRDHDRRW